MPKDNPSQESILFSARGVDYRMANHVNVSATVCSQCGACESVCPKDAITMPRLPSGDYYPLIDEEKCAASCKLCTYVCGGNGIDWEALHPWRFGTPYEGDALGHHVAAYSAHATDPELRVRSASGGSVSALLCHALETGRIDAAAVSGLNGVEPVPRLAATREEILACAGSIYYSNPALISLREMRKFPGRVAFVGLPCHIASLNMAIRNRVIKPEKVAFTVALICGRTANFDLMRSFMRRMGIDPETVEDLKMRGDGWPGTFRIRTRDGKLHRFPFPGPEYMSMWKFYQYTPVYCLMCSDPLGNLADITAGDAWLPEFGEDSHGRSVLLVRTQAADDLLRDARKEGAVHLDPLEPARILKAQRQQVFGKLLNQRTMRRVFQWTRPLTGWPMPRDTGTQFWRKGSLFGLGYAVFQFINCTFSNNPRLRPLLRLLPLVTLARVMGRKRAHVKAARRHRKKGGAMGPRIAIIGSYTGRNAGDAAILENVVRDVAEQVPDARLEVFTINPGFVRRTYAGLPLRPIATLPWNLSVKTLGLPILLAARRCDAIIVTSAILFDRKYWNPLYNYLTSLQLALPLAKRLGKAVFFYSVGVGPIYTERGRRIVRSLIEKSDGITLREEASVDIMRDLGIDKQPVMAADPALNQQIPDTVREEVREELDRRIGAGPRVSINVNAYLDDWTGREGEGRLGRDEFCRIMGEVARRIVDDWGWGVVLICTHYMDEGITRAVADAAGRPDRVMVMENRHYDHRQLMAAMAATEFMIGMRLHCQILAVAAGTPCVALNYAPKVRHFMRMAGLEEYTIDFGGGFGADTVLGVAQGLRDALGRVRRALAERVAELQAQAKRSAIELARVLDRRGD